MPHHRRRDPRGCPVLAAAVVVSLVPGGGEAAPPTGTASVALGRPVTQTTNGVGDRIAAVLSIVVLFVDRLPARHIFGFKAAPTRSRDSAVQTGDGLALAGIIIGFVTLVDLRLRDRLWIVALTPIHSAITNDITSRAASPNWSRTVKGMPRSLRSRSMRMKRSVARPPTPPAPSSQSTYVSNSSPLTSRHWRGAFLDNPLGTANYTSGTLSPAPSGCPPNTFEAAYDPTQDFSANPDACVVAVTP